MALRRLACAGLLVAAVALIAATGVSSAVRPPITQAQSGKTFRLAKGQTATLRLSNRWSWSEPRVSTRAVELTAVEYYVDPGFREWRIDARAFGTAVIRSVGRPACGDCRLTARNFRVTLVVR